MLAGQKSISTNWNTGHPGDNLSTSGVQDLNYESSPSLGGINLDASESMVDGFVSGIPQK